MGACFSFLFLKISDILWKQNKRKKKEKKNEKKFENKTKGNIKILFLTYNILFLFYFHLKTNYTLRLRKLNLLL
jgi:hypothetical protein